MKIMGRAEFARFLRLLADDVETGDSLEGSLQYTYALIGRDDVEVEAAVRTGNLQGQGGMTIL